MLSYSSVRALSLRAYVLADFSKHINPKTKRLHTGVAQHEYTDVLRDHFIPQGQKLFVCWQVD